MAIQFNINPQKAIEVVLWVIQKGESNVYNVMKILYAAEKYHLNKFGRPVTGDRYVAMEYGTVPSWIYNATNLKRSGLGFVRNDNTLTAERACDTNYLSESDIEALENGFAAYAGKTFQEVLNKNHAEIAWQRAYEKRGNNNAVDIAFEDMIEEKWLIEELTQLAPNLVI